MTDTDRMGQLQEVAHQLRVLAEATPQEPAPMPEQVENLRSLRTLTDALAKLVSDAAGQAIVESRDGNGYVTKIKNPMGAVGQVALQASLALDHAAASLRKDVAGALQMAEMNLARIEPAPVETEETAGD